MKKKWLFTILFVCLFLLTNLSFISSVEFNSTQIDNAYTCLNSEIIEKGCQDLSMQEKVFSFLATGKCKLELLDEKANSGCFSNSGCNVQNTAMAMWALNEKSVSVEDSKNWLITQKGAPTNMEWLLQIDTADASTCSIIYEINSNPVTTNVDFNEDKTIGNLQTNNCLRVSQGGYWLDIDSNCYGSDFEISCDQDFTSSLIFKNSGDSAGTLHVLSGANGASADGKTIESVNSDCFEVSGVCNYEASLWSVLALESIGEDISSYMPYLIVMAEDETNDRFLPEAFLYFITQNNEYQYSLLNKQIFNKYWQEISTNNKFYDTALALYPFRYDDIVEKQNTINWLLEEGVQDEDGCWDNKNIKSNAFLLYSVWPRATTGSVDPEPVSTCETAGYSCEGRESCWNGGGRIIDSYTCSGAGYFCCEVGLSESCSEKQGEICDSNQRCVNGVEDATANDLLYSGEVCCVWGSCEDIDDDNGENTGANTCESSNSGVCRYSCETGEEETAYYSCSSSQVCCQESSDPKGTNIWVWILIILIILIVLGIIYKDKLRELMFRMKSGKKDSTGPKGPRRGPPRMAHQLRGPLPRRPMPPRQIPSSAKRGKGELDDVLGKLREMGK